MSGTIGRLGAWLVALIAVGAGCDSDDLRGNGEPCFASSECGPGLVCDLAADPPTCTGTSIVPGDPDAPPATVFDAAPGQPDAAAGPDAAPGQPDAAPPDAAPPDAAPPDAAPPDAAPPDAA